MKDVTLVDAEIRLHYRAPNGYVVDAGAVQFGTHWYDAWLEGMVSRNSDIIFFMTVQTTDVFEKEIDYNTVVSYADNVVINHSCSCHARNQGPCDVCKTMGCEVWYVNIDQVAVQPPDWEDDRPNPPLM